jgi:outer membrane immunogenic protein
MVFGGYATAERSQLEQNYPTQGVNFETGRNLTAGARAGLVISRNVLAYGKVGYSNGRLKPAFTTTAAGAPYTDFSENRNGIHFGGGFEIPTPTNFYVKLDYTHTLYKDFQVNDNTELRFDRKQLTAGIGYRF